jgi:hypothetical protein
LAATPARRVQIGKLKGNETPPNHNNRSRSFGGVRFNKASNKTTGQKCFA